MITPDGATLIISGWLEKESELFLSASMINFSVYAKCRVVAIVEGKVTLRCVSPDSAVFSFSLESPRLSIRYAEPREFSDTPEFIESVPEEKRLNSALIITLPLKETDSSSAGLRETIRLLEL